ncbi:MAG: hypothetical protein V7719_07965, partial [Psychroserpens sp.]|uniref:hypothetical protein n=1 Tax=Psychroserpens sp. TaxID=2020870 RepID=UPI003001E38E
MKKIWLIGLICIFFVDNSWSQDYVPPPEYDIVAAEYFFDSDTGVGNAGVGNIGNSLSVTPGTAINQTFNISTVGLSEGLHVLHIRTQDSNGTWSLFKRQYFFINSGTGYVDPPEYDIVDAEYFFDTDTGVGNAGNGNIGGVIPLIDASSIDDTFVIPTTGLSVGLHVLHIRTQDANGTWSLFKRQYFFINPGTGYVDPPEYDIVEAEYFFDTDTGVGNAGNGNIGGVIPLIDASSINETFVIPTTDLSEGLHVLYIRTKDANETWSLYERRYFFINSGAGYVDPPEYNIVEVEYFFDTDTGVGNAGNGNIGGSFTVTDNLTINESFVIPITSLTDGLHILHIRSKDANNTWSLYERKYFFIMQLYQVPTPVNIVSAEFFVTSDLNSDVDPGVGNGTPIIINPGMTIDDTLVIPVECWEPSLNTDDYTLHIRVKDQNDTWSLYDFDLFTVEEDMVPPTTICQDVTVTLDEFGNGSLTATEVDNGSNDACGIQSLVIDKTTFTCSDLGDSTVTLTVTDNKDNVATCDVTVTVIDTTAPIVVTKNIVVELDGNGNATITEDAVEDGSTDACGPLSFDIDKNTFNCNDVGNNTVTLTVSDGSSNDGFANAIVTILDVTPPNVITKNITIQLDENGIASIAENAVDDGSNDACGGLIFNTDITNFDCSNIGENVVTLVVTDANTNAANATATITVEDNVLPEAICQNITIQLDETGNATFASGSAIIAHSINDFSGTQGAGNWTYGKYFAFDSANFSQLPNYSILNFATNPDFAWNDNQPFNTPFLSKDVGHPGQDLSWAVRRWTSNINGTINLAGEFYDGDTGCGDGSHARILLNGAQVLEYLDLPSTTQPYNLQINVSIGDTVDFAIDPKFNYLCDSTFFTATITTTDGIDNGSNDACGIASYSIDKTTFDCNDLGSNPVILTVTDNNGNISTCNATVTVEDNIDPTITATNDIITTSSADDLGDCNTDIDIPDAIIDDNCESNLTWIMSGSVTASGSDQIGIYNFPVGITTIEYTNTDAALNIATDDLIITVTDDELPSIVGLSTDIPLDSDPSLCGAITNWTEPTPDDNCPGSTIAQTAGLANGALFPVGSTT